MVSVALYVPGTAPPGIDVNTNGEDVTEAPTMSVKPCPCAVPSYTTSKVVGEFVVAVYGRFAVGVPALMEGLVPNVIVGIGFTVTPAVT